MGNDIKAMPVLFVGHGNPMNAIETNNFTENWHKLGQTLPRPRSILCVSAHWETQGTRVTSSAQPATIHDFGGFPRELYDVRYPAAGNPELARQTIETIKTTTVLPDEQWGLDHGTWSVIKHVYPRADIPVIQLSLDYYKTPAQHFELAKELLRFRQEGVLIVGSGNIVHNLHRVAWDRPHEESYGYDWVIEANEQVKNCIKSSRFDELIHYQQMGKEVQLAIPTPDHFLPLLYALALKTDADEVSFFNDKPVMGSLTMTSVLIGQTN